MNGSSVPLKALLINCTLTPSPGESSTEKLAGEVAKALEKQGVSCSMIRAVDLNLKPGVEADMGEDGAHKISADVFQALNDVGFSLAPGAVTYWNGEAMHTVDYKDLESTPDAVASTIASLAVNAVHLARPLEQQTYPPAS